MVQIAAGLLPRETLPTMAFVRTAGNIVSMKPSAKIVMAQEMLKQTKKPLKMKKTLTNALPTLRALAAWYKLDLHDARLITAYRYAQAHICHQLSTEIGIMCEISNSPLSDYKLRASILN